LLLFLSFPDRPDNYKCGHTKNEWEGPLKASIFSSPELDHVELEIEASPSAECLRTTPSLQEMQHPGIITHHNFQIDEDGYLNIGRLVFNSIFLNFFF
jgi:hypothetical protein